MPSQITRANTRRQQGAKAFGRMIRRWRILNNWTQYTGQRWSEAAGFDFLSHGGLSPLEAGTVKHPRWILFGHFAEMNRRLAAQDFGGVHDRQLLDQLKGAQPMRDDDGGILEEEVLAGIHMGTRRVPAELWVPEPDPAPALTDADAAALCETWRALVAEECARRGQRKVSCLNTLKSFVPAADLELFQDVVADQTTYTADQLQRLWSVDHWLPNTWIEAWTEAHQDLTPARGGGGGG